MNCPVCPALRDPAKRDKTQLQKALLSGVEIDYCPRCYGLWFEENELRWAKDEKDRSLRWLDIDVWKDPTKFRVSRGKKMCPKDRMPLYEVEYGDSNIRVDVCNLDHGIWLDRGEFKDVIAYLKEKSHHEVLNHYLKNLKEELWEVFLGPEMLKEEILDVLALLKLLVYKFATQYLLFTQLMPTLPK